jgi:polyphosphate kinase
VARRLSFPVASEDLLEAMASTTRPVGMRAGQTGYRLLRETYFDTPDGVLRERRMTLRLRLDAGGLRTLSLVSVSAMNLEGVVEESVLEEPVTGEGLYETLAGQTELASRLREIVEPVALRPLLAVDVDREIRDLRTGWLRRPVHRVHFDRIVAHTSGATRSLQQVEVTELAPGGPGLETVAERLRAQHGLSADGLDTLERATRILAGATAANRADAPHEVRGAFLILRGGTVALAEGAHGLTLPAARGSGEDLARAFLSELFGGGHPAQDVELVGFAQSRKDTPDLEVWLHEIHASVTPPERFLWIPLPELLERVGAPRLRDPALTAALLLLARSEVGRKLLRETPRAGGVPSVVPPSPRSRDAAAGSDPEDFLDTELSILDFNQRVLELAEDPSLPLLERFRFLAIFASNMDEFFVVRVGRLKTESRSASAAEATEADGLLDLIAIRTRALLARQYACLTERLLPTLAERGIRIRRWTELGPEEREGLARRFSEEIFPLLTPRAMSAAPGHPFPRLTSLGLSLAAVLHGADGDRPHLAHVPIPEGLPRFLRVGDGPDLVAIEDVVEGNAAMLFPSFDVQEVHAFRVSRLGEVDIDEDVSDSLLEAIEDEVEARPYKPVVRIEVQESMPREMRAHLLRELRSERGSDSAVLSRGDVFEVDGPLDLWAFAQIADLDLPGERYQPFTPRRPLEANGSIFEVLGDGDVLVHHPFDSFDHTVGRFLEEAAHDPAVVSIKLTLYRTGRESPLAAALVDALRNGKEVSAFVELKARFDEESNIHWTHRLIEAGGHVVYGLVGFKTHAKTALVVRREDDGLRRYVHIGTGNYNAATARFYTDLGLLSADGDLGADLNDFFNELMGSAGPPGKTYRRLWVAPHSLATNLLRCIEREAEHARAGRPARIQAKMNGLTDRKIVKALYRAAQDGVQVDLIVRAICTLRPGVEGLSENIRVRSILGRFLEHARIFYFENGGNEEYCIGSADWRRRNLRKRVEVVTPVIGEGPRARLREILDTELGSARAWILRHDGAYERLSGDGVEAQVHFLP